MIAAGWDTSYLRRRMIDHSNNVTTLTPPATLTLVITTVVLPVDAVVMPSPSIEYSGNGYAPTTLTWGATLWNAADATGAATNKLLVTCFTATANWTVPGLGFAIKDASNNIWVAGALVDAAGTAQPMLPSTGQIVTFPPGSIIRQVAAPS